MQKRIAIRVREHQRIRNGRRETVSAHQRQYQEAGAIKTLRIPLELIISISISKKA